MYNQLNTNMLMMKIEEALNKQFKTSVEIITKINEDNSINVNVSQPTISNCELTPMTLSTAIDELFYQTRGNGNLFTQPIRYSFVIGAR